MKPVLSLSLTPLALGALLSTAAAAAPPEPLPEGRSLEGEWRYLAGDLARSPRELPPGLPAMQVPSNWYERGLDRAGVVWFFREVTVPEGSRRFALFFEGVDYAADVYWDGLPVSHHRGYFAPFWAELPEGAGTHLLAVRVDSPEEPPSAWSLRKTLVKGVLSHHDTRPGGAWSVRGQEGNTGGIWGAVRLVPVAHGRLDSLRLDTLSLSPEAARAEVSVAVSGVRERGLALRFRLLDREGAVVAEGPLGEPAVQPYQRVRGELTVRGPHPWQPREVGEPYLYRLEVTLSGPGGADRAAAPVGLRTVERNARGQFVINGRPIFLRGTNYIGTLYPGSLPPGTIERDLELMQQAHVNAIRVHAHVASPRFYELADSHGLVVWQDFPLQWGYDDGAAFRREAVEQARELVDAFGRHPSIILWSAHNEPPWSSDWMVYRYPDYDPDQNRLLDQALLDAFTREDPRRPAQQDSPSAEHAWAGWYFGRYQDFAKPAAVPVASEFGAQAVPELSTLRTFLREGELWPLAGHNLEAWQFHNFQLEELTRNARVSPGRSVQELIHNTQDYQARLIQFAAEALRRQKWQPITGIFQFMFCEHWPSTSWGVVDYLRKPKAGYFALARAYQPLLPVAARRGARQSLSVYVVNDGPAVEAGATVVATFEQAGERQQLHLPLEVAADDVTRALGEIPLPRAGQRLSLRVEDSQGRPLADNLYPPGFFTP